MMWQRAALFDQMPLPRNMGIKVRIWIFPPPHFIALPISAEDDIGMTVAIHIADHAAGFQSKESGFDDVTVPTVGGAAVPNQCRGRLPEAQHKAVGPVHR